MINMALLVNEAAGPLPGKSGNLHCDFDGMHRIYMLKYFCLQDTIRPGRTQRGPGQDETAFDTGFGMSKSVFNRVRKEICSFHHTFGRVSYQTPLVEQAYYL